MKKFFRNLKRNLPAILLLISFPAVVIFSLICKGAAIVTVVGAILALSGTATWYTFNVGVVVTVGSFILVIGSLLTMTVAKVLLD